MTDQKFDVHFWGIPNRRAGHKKDIWSVGNWPLSEFADRVPKDHREEYGPATRMGWQWRYDSSPNNTLITFLTPVQTGEEGEAFFAGSVVVPKGMAIGVDLLEQVKSQVCRAAETLSNSRKAERPSSYEPIQTSVHPIDSFGASRIAAESWMFEVSNDSDVASICNQLSTLHHSNLTCCFLTKHLPEEHRSGIVKVLGKVLGHLQMKGHPDWQALRQEDETRHNEAEQKHLKEEKKRKELEELKRAQAEQEALRRALEKEAKRKEGSVSSPTTYNSSRCMKLRLDSLRVFGLRPPIVISRASKAEILWSISPIPLPNWNEVHPPAKRSSGIFLSPERSAASSFRPTSPRMRYSGLL